MDVVEVDSPSMEDVGPLGVGEVGRSSRGLLSPEGSGGNIGSSSKDDAASFSHVGCKFLCRKLARGGEPGEVFLADFLNLPLRFWVVVGPKAAVTFPKLPKVGLVVSIEASMPNLSINGTLDPLDDIGVIESQGYSWGFAFVGRVDKVGEQLGFGGRLDSLMQLNEIGASQENLAKREVSGAPFLEQVGELGIVTVVSGVGGGLVNLWSRGTLAGSTGPGSLT